MVKLGFTGVYFFLIFALGHGAWVLVRTAPMRRFWRVPAICVLGKNGKKYHNFSSEIIIFIAVIYCSILHGRVFEMIHKLTDLYLTSIVPLYL